MKNLLTFAERESKEEGSKGVFEGERLRTFNKCFHGTKMEYLMLKQYKIL